MNPTLAARLAWTLWALVVALTALSLLLLWLNSSRPDAPIFDWWLGNALVVIDATVGAMVASRRPANLVGWLLCLSSVAVGTSTFASQYAIYALLGGPGSLPAGEALAWVASWLLPVMIALQIFAFLLFPTGRLPGRRWRWAVWLTIAFVAAGVGSSAFASDAYFGALGPIRNPLAVEGFDAVYKAVLFAGAPLLHGLAALSLISRLRRSRGVERQQVKWFAYAVTLYALSIAVNIALFVIDVPRWLEWVQPALLAATGVLVPIAIGIAILRHRLYDIDLLINRTVVYGVLTAALGVVYFGGVTLLQGALRAVTGGESQLAVVVSTLTIAALFDPLRRRVQALVDRRFYRKKYDARRTLERFSETLRDETDLGGLREDLVGALDETVQPSLVSVWLRPPADPGDRQAG